MQIQCMTCILLYRGGEVNLKMIIHVYLGKEVSLEEILRPGKSS